MSVRRLYFVISCLRLPKLVSSWGNEGSTTCQCFLHTHTHTQHTQLHMHAHTDSGAVGASQGERHLFVQNVVVLRERVCCARLSVRSGCHAKPVPYICPGHTVPELRNALQCTTWDDT